MKIAMIGQKGIYPVRGGVERHVAEISTRLAALGHEVTVYSRLWYCGEKSTKYQDVNLVFVPSLHTKNLDTISHVFFSTLHALFQNFDVIHYHGVGPALLSWIPRVFNPNVSIVTTIHCLDRLHTKWGSFARFMLKLGEWCALRFSHKTIVVSHTLERYCKTKYHQPSVYIPNGFSEERESNRLQEETLQQYGLSAGEYMLAVSRFTPHKGLHTLIDAYKGLDTKKALVLVGDSRFEDKKYEKRLWHMSQGYNILILANVALHDVFNLYKRCAFTVLPSEVEGLPIVILESLSFGKAVFCSDISPNRELVLNDDYRFQPRNVADIRRKLNYGLAHPKEIQKEGEKGKEMVYDYYHWEKILPEIFSVYKGASHRVQSCTWSLKFSAKTLKRKA